VHKKSVAWCDASERSTQEIQQANVPVFSPGIRVRQE